MGRARDTFVRICHESSLWDENSCLTLTYNDACLPPDECLDVREWQLFRKALRHRVGPFRYWGVGEYGRGEGTTQRPHFHVCIFGRDFATDARPVPGEPGYWRSDAVADAWKRGDHRIGILDQKAAKYVARYVTEKLTGDAEEEFLQGRTPEFSFMSRRPGIGAGWFRKHQDAVFPRDELVCEGKLMKPPRYYQKLLEKNNADQHAEVIARRVQHVRDNPDSSDAMKRREHYAKKAKALFAGR